MYNNIEKTYKKKSTYYRLKKIELLIYVLTIIMVWILLSFKYYWSILAVMIITVICIKKVAEIVLGQKLSFRFSSKNDKYETIDEIADKQDKLLFKKYLIAQRINNPKALKLLIDYNGKQIKNKKDGYDYLSILSILITIASPYMELNNYTETTNIILKIIVFSFICYFPTKEFFNYIKSTYSKNEMYKRLERIFSNLYLDLIIENIDNNNKTYECNNGVLVNFKIISGDYNSTGVDDIPIKYRISEIFDSNIKMNELIKYLAYKYMQPTEANLKNPYYYCTNYPKVLWEEYFDSKSGMLNKSLIIETDNAYDIELWKLDKQFNLSNKTIELVICGPGIGGGVGYFEGIRFFFHTNEKERHNQSHIHCSYSGEEIRVDLETLTIMKPCKSFKNKKKTKKTLELIKLNQKELISYWNKVVKNGEYLKFEMIYEPQKDT